MIGRLRFLLGFRLFSGCKLLVSGSVRVGDVEKWLYIWRQSAAGNLSKAKPKQAQSRVACISGVQIIKTWWRSSAEAWGEWKKLGGGFKYCLSLTLLGEMIQFDEHVFQGGWNHQLEKGTPLKANPMNIHTVWIPIWLVLRAKDGHFSPQNHEQMSSWVGGWAIASYGYLCIDTLLDTLPRYNIHILRGLVGLNTPREFNLESVNKGSILRFFVSFQRFVFTSAGSGRMVYHVQSHPKGSCELSLSFGWLVRFVLY